MSRHTRRDLLAAVGVGVAGLAGCSSLPWTDETERSYDREVLGDVAALGHPALPRRIPAPIEASYLDDRRAAVREGLDAVPSPIPESDIPNEVVRDQVARLRSRAVDSLARAESAATPFERLETLRSALGSALGARAGYEAATGGLTRQAVLNERPEVRADLQAFREERRVVGGIDGATVVLQGTVERYLRSTDRWLSNADDQRHATGRTMVIAETAQSIAFARFTLADARHLSEQFRASRETRPVGDAFERAADALLADVRRRIDALPGESFTDDPAQFLDVEGDLGQPARELVTRAYREAAWRHDPEDAGEGSASRLLAAHGADHALRTFERVRETVEDGGHSGPIDAGTVRAAKLDALGAVERARSDPAHSALTNIATSRVRYVLEDGDRYLGVLADGFDDPAETVAYAYAAYVRAGVIARTIAPTNAWVVGTIETAAGPDPDD